MDVATVLADLIAEQEALEEVVIGLTEEQWRLPTPSPRWSVVDQIGHLTYFDATAAQAITDPDGFVADAKTLMGSMTASAEESDEATLGAYRAMTGPEVIEAWRANRELLAAAGRTLDGATRVVWYGPSMGAKSFLTARLMETWAHGQDIVDTLGADRPASDRLKHVAQIGFITRGWSYANRGLTPPEEPVKVVLEAPSGDTWTFGPDDATESVSGSAVDFCMVVTQRRHVDDTDLATTPLAHDWLVKAQAFAGGATDGPAPSK